jgi:hypothetical protein
MQECDSGGEYTNFHLYAAAEWAKLEDRSKWEELAEADKRAYADEKEQMSKKVSAKMGRMHNAELMTRWF